MQTTPQLKPCTLCLLAKPLEQFGRVKDGHHARCKACRNDQRKQRYQANVERERKWRATYVRNNPERCSAYGKVWRERNPALLRERSRDYYHSHKAQYRAHGLRASREAREALADSYITKLITNAKRYDGHSITPEEIAQVRARVQAKRDGTYKAQTDRRESNRKQLAGDRAQLTDSYLRRQIVASRAYAGEEITPHMLEQARQRILGKRARRQGNQQ